MRKNQKFWNLSSAGFTLIELMVVILIIGLLAAIVVPQFTGRTEEAKVSITKTNIQNLNSALGIFYMDNDRYPEQLEHLIEKPSYAKKFQEGGYLRGGVIPKDGWGNDLKYTVESNYKKYKIISYGADSQPGGDGYDADISSDSLAKQ